MRTDTTIITPDRHQLYVRHYQPETRNATRTLVMVHGVCEHGERYDAIARLAVRRGWNVVLADQRGHGLSSGVHTHVDHFNQYVHDIDLVCQRFKCLPSQTFLVGHSMGGLVSVRYAQTYTDRLAGLVLVSPLLSIKVKVPWPTVAVGWLLSHLTPRVRFQPRFNAADSTRCPKLQAARADDPLIRRSLTNGWYFAVRAALRRAWLDAKKLTMPVLLVQAGQDRVVDAAKSKQWLSQLPATDASLHWLDESYHDVLGESDWLHTFAHIARWLERRITHLRQSSCDIPELPPLTESWLRSAAA
jgi:lysophospholipase